jgi:hypothetical protein
MQDEGCSTVYCQENRVARRWWLTALRASPRLGTVFSEYAAGSEPYSASPGLRPLAWFAAEIGSHRTLCWRGMDSNCQFRDASQPPSVGAFMRR